MIATGLVRRTENAEANVKRSISVHRSCEYMLQQGPLKMRSREVSSAVLGQIESTTTLVVTAASISFMEHPRKFPVYVAHFFKAPMSVRDARIHKIVRQGPTVMKWIY
jgi:hypothetical protein